MASEENGKNVLRELESIATSEQITNALEAIENGQWCQFVILAQGRRFIIRLNGVTLTDTRDEHPTRFVPRGMLGLEYSHREGVEDSVELKEIRFKRLPPEAAQ